MDVLSTLASWGTYFNGLFFVSSNLAMVVDGAKENNVLEDVGCGICEMAVVWAQNQLMNNRSSEYIKNYLDDVKKYLTNAVQICIANN